jgi:hypothetical protein
VLGQRVRPPGRALERVTTEENQTVDEAVVARSVPTVEEDVGDQVRRRLHVHTPGSGAHLGQPVVEFHDFVGRKKDQLRFERGGDPVVVVGGVGAADSGARRLDQAPERLRIHCVASQQLRVRRRHVRRRGYAAGPPHCGGVEQPTLGRRRGPRRRNACHRRPSRDPRTGPGRGPGRLHHQLADR